MLRKAPVLEFSSTYEIHLVLGGTYFPNDICLVVYRNFHLKLIQLYRMTDGEHFEEIAEDLQNFLNLGIKIKNITADGDRSSIKAIKKVCPKVPFQRCLPHKSRTCRIWLMQNPKHKSGFELKQKVVKIHHINSECKCQLWFIELIQWEEEYRDFINQKSYKYENWKILVYP